MHVAGMVKNQPKAGLRQCFFNSFNLKAGSRQLCRQLWDQGDYGRDSHFPVRHPAINTLGEPWLCACRQGVCRCPLASQLPAAELRSALTASWGGSGVLESSSDSLGLTRGFRDGAWEGEVQRWFNFPSPFLLNPHGTRFRSPVKSSCEQVVGFGEQLRVWLSNH